MIVAHAVRMLHVCAWCGDHMHDGCPINHMAICAYAQGIKSRDGKNTGYTAYRSAHTRTRSINNN